ncbi:EAL domain-containing protein [Vibrio sp. S4M6]|uniref:EAL domain-containing protein n=1 Tax=Vibrio sinus TaxID=2946865 RepID=UPI00202A42C3|nr:EAL domain-containing protein [Vibrio sinus]MCL9781123.1 EAL domain-containing protein [Vibrio sinus]
MLPSEIQGWFQAITQDSPFFFAILDNQYRYTAVNKRYQDISGMAAAQLIGKNDELVFGESTFQTLALLYQQALAGEMLETEVSLLSQGRETTLHVFVYPITVSSVGAHIAFQAIDVTEKHRLIESVRESEDKYSTLTRLIPFGVMLVEDSAIISANDACAQLLGFSTPKEILGENLEHLFIDGKTKEAYKESIGGLLKEKPISCFTSPACGLERRIQLFSGNAQLYGAPLQLILLQEIPPRADMLSTCTHDVYRDSVTGLYNRMGFIQCTEQLINQSSPLILLYLDIDNFKNINDSLGHQIGDLVLREVAERLKDIFPSTSLIGRLGGDEFGIIVKEAHSEEAIANYAKSIKLAIYQPFDLHYFNKRLTCSIGSVSYPDGGKNTYSLLQNANSAMYQAKYAGRNRLVAFDEKIGKEARKRLWIEIELQKALQHDGLEVWYQPKVSSENYLIVGAEALIRWKHPVEGYISPSEFIPVAENAGLIENIGRVVMREVFRSVKLWKVQNILPGKIAINLSPEQFLNTQLVGYVEKLLTSTQLDPSCIAFELTESSIMRNSLDTLKMLNALKSLGFSLSIDDFGTGYSSLSYLARFPIDELKIDRAFITDIESLPKQLTVVESIVNLGKSLELTVVAEGIETEQQAQLLKKLKCDSLQGFYFHTPKPKHEVEKLFLADMNRRKTYQRVKTKKRNES